MSSKSHYLNEQQIKRLRQHAENYAYVARSKSERDVWLEATACLDDAKPEYLCNLIPANHPDRVEALRLIDELQLI